MIQHTPVLLHEMLQALDPKEGEVYIDATYGGGGYTQAILAKARCHVIAFDRDPDAAINDVICAPFSQMRAHCPQPVHGVVFDFGVSSHQLDQAHRGFSFQQEGPLDMRMSQQGVSAYDVINQFSQGDLTDIIKTYGEEPRAHKIARAIVENRPIQTTTALAAIIGPRQGKRHPATKTFQAIRIYVNDELREIDEGLKAAYDLLVPGGRMVAVTFHSLEDRIVKIFFKQQHSATLVHPSFSEIKTNPRARSAKLRWMIKGQQK